MLKSTSLPTLSLRAEENQPERPEPRKPVSLIEQKDAVQNTSPTSIGVRNVKDQTQLAGNPDLESRPDSGIGSMPAIPNAPQTESTSDMGQTLFLKLQEILPSYANDPCNSDSSDSDDDLDSGYIRACLTATSSKQSTTPKKMKSENNQSVTEATILKACTKQLDQYIRNYISQMSLTDSINLCTERALQIMKESTQKIDQLVQDNSSSELMVNLIRDNVITAKVNQMIQEHLMAFKTKDWYEKLSKEQQHCIKQLIACYEAARDNIFEDSNIRVTVASASPVTAAFMTVVQRLLLHKKDVQLDCYRQFLSEDAIQTALTQHWRLVQERKANKPTKKQSLLPPQQTTIPNNDALCDNNDALCDFFINALQKPAQDAIDAKIYNAIKAPDSPTIEALWQTYNDKLTTQFQKIEVYTQVVYNIKSITGMEKAPRAITIQNAIKDHPVVQTIESLERETPSKNFIETVMERISLEEIQRIIRIITKDN